MMPNLKHTFSIVLLVLFTVGMCACSNTTGPGSDAKDHILGVAPITEIFADGWKTTAVVIQYDKAIDSSTLSPSDYRVITEVEGQDITRVYTNNEAAKTETGAQGPYVILELSHDYIADIAKAAQTEGIKAVAPMSDDIAPNPIEQTGNISWDPAAHPATLLAPNQGGDGKDVYVYQVGDITTIDGDRYAAFENKEEAVANYGCLNLILDDILKPDYHNDKGDRAKYNIYFPENFDEGKAYPAVVYLTDEKAGGGRHADVLTNGGAGAVVWADPAAQLKHECIVIVPAFRGAIVDENYESTEHPFGNGGVLNSYNTIINLMDYLTGQFSYIDEDRVYLTGQGEGARAAIKMMIDRPYMFAAALLFASDYDPNEMPKLSDGNMWIVTSEADDIAAPSMEKCMTAIEGKGKAVSRAVWDGQASDEQFAAYIKDMIGQGSDIKYSVFEKGTLVPEGLTDDSAGNRTYSWRKGYAIEGLRDWLFTQKMTEDGHVDHVTTITKVFKDGQKPAAVAIEYDGAISNATVDAGDFEVMPSDAWQAAVKANKGVVDIDVHVTKVYANTSPEMTPEGVDGNYVIIEISTDYELPIRTAATLNFVPEVGVLQAGDITTTDGETIPANAGKVWQSDTVHRQVVDDFRQFVYTDPDTGGMLMYNLYVPENYDETRSYPMVLFMHDGSVAGPNHIATLLMCFGASIWATPAEQAKHPCFVLAPQFTGKIAGDDSTYTEDVPMAMRLVRSLMESYSIDPGKVYTTGQSAGCMVSMAMMIIDHDLFAKAFLVAGQWGAGQGRSLYDKNLWIVVSEGDLKAFPGMNASKTVWEDEGATVTMPKDVPGWKGPNSWDANATPEQFAEYVRDMIAVAGDNIKYTPLTKATVVPEGQDTGGGNHHMYSFRRAYAIEAIRDWLFSTVPRDGQ